MDRSHSTQLENLRNKANQMGQHAQKALGLVLQALIEKRIEIFDQVFEIEKQINEWHKQVDEDAVEFMAQNGPVAKDLRTTVALVKINTDLERMGDQCVNIAYIGKDALKRGDDLNLPIIRTMFSLVQEMIEKSLSSFIKHDAKVAEKVLMMDDEVDTLKAKVQSDMILSLKQDPLNAEKYLALILVARNLERFGDHATNIAEDVIYTEAGQDIRHGGFL